MVNVVVDVGSVMGECRLRLVVVGWVGEELRRRKTLARDWRLHRHVGLARNRRVRYSSGLSEFTGGLLPRLHPIHQVHSCSCPLILPNLFSFLTFTSI